LEHRTWNSIKGGERMEIGFIGAGKVGTAFGTYLFKKGFKIAGYYSRTLKSAERAAGMTNSSAYENIEDLSKNSEIIFITTSDDEISKVCEDLVRKNALKKSQILVHMSGASSSNILKRAKAKGCFIYSLHPLQSFADISKAIDDLENTMFSIEGDEERIKTIEDILKATGNKYFKLSSEQKSIYHAAACVISNYLVTLMDYGLSLFEVIGIDKEEGYRALYPLIEGTTKNIYSLGTEKALTGPIARGDTGTIKKHLNSLKSVAPDKMDFYSIMGMMTVNLASKNKLKNMEKIKNLQNILKEVL
jgi:predicted short-subunit dehydrogenase-like oxidoreductase (DUF2520 family)